VEQNPTSIILSGDGSQQLKIYALDTVTSNYGNKTKNNLAFLVVEGGKMTF
jgi:hypothetical protein